MIKHHFPTPMIPLYEAELEMKEHQKTFLSILKWHQNVIKDLCSQIEELENQVKLLSQK